MCAIILRANVYRAQLRAAVSFPIIAHVTVIFAFTNEVIIFAFTFLISSSFEILDSI